MTVRWRGKDTFILDKNENLFFVANQELGKTEYVQIISLASSFPFSQIRIGVDASDKLAELRANSNLLREGLSKCFPFQRESKTDIHFISNSLSELRNRKFAADSFFLLSFFCARSVLGDRKTESRSQPLGNGENRTSSTFPRSNWQLLEAFG